MRGFRVDVVSGGFVWLFDFLKVLLTPTGSYWLLLAPTEQGEERWIDGLVDIWA